MLGPSISACLLLGLFVVTSFVSLFDKYENTITKIKATATPYPHFNAGGSAGVETGTPTTGCGWLTGVTPIVVITGVLVVPPRRTSCHFA